MGTEPAQLPGSIRFGEDFEFDFHAYRLRRGGRVLKMERIPAEVLAVLVEQRGELVSRQHIVERIWGKDVFLDTDNSINGAIRKVRHVLKDDPEQPRFIQTITGRGYRFIAPVNEPVAPKLVEVPKLPPPPPSPPVVHKPALALQPITLAIFFVALPRRPKTGNNRGMLILLNEEEKMSIEKAAAKEGVSMSRFIVERALHAAKRVLSQTA